MGGWSDAKSLGPLPGIKLCTSPDLPGAQAGFAVWDWLKFVIPSMVATNNRGDLMIKHILKHSQNEIVWICFGTVLICCPLASYSWITRMLFYHRTIVHGNNGCQNVVWILDAARVVFAWCICQAWKHTVCLISMFLPPRFGIDPPIFKVCFGVFSSPSNRIPSLLLCQFMCSICAIPQCDDMRLWNQLTSMRQLVMSWPYPEVPHLGRSRPFANLLISPGTKRERWDRPGTSPKS